MVPFFSVPLSNETLHAHPFFYRGLVSYCVFQVEDSSWIRALTSAQFVHPRPTQALSRTVSTTSSVFTILTFFEDMFACYVVLAMPPSIRRDGLLRRAGYSDSIRLPVAFGGGPFCKFLQKTKLDM
jgi:hypothetical protein